MDRNAAPVKRNVAPVDPPPVALMLDEEDKMFRDCLLGHRKEYASFLEPWPSYSDYTKPSYEALKNAIKLKGAETLSKIESARSSSSAVSHEKP